MTHSVYTSQEILLSFDMYCNNLLAIYMYDIVHKVMCTIVIHVNHCMFYMLVATCFGTTEDKYNGTLCIGQQNQKYDVDQ